MVCLLDTASLHQGQQLTQAAGPGVDGGHRVGAGLLALLILPPVPRDRACRKAHTSQLKLRCKHYEARCV